MFLKIYISDEHIWVCWSTDSYIIDIRAKYCSQHDLLPRVIKVTDLKFSIKAAKLIERTLLQKGLLATEFYSDLGNELKKKMLGSLIFLNCSRSFLHKR